MSAAHLVVVGASLAGLRAVESARKSGHPGRITLIGDEPHLPYDRPPLSKDFLAADIRPKPALHWGEARFAELEVDLRLGRRASELDIGERRISVGGELIEYDGLVIATGAAARSLPGAEGLRGVHTLRTLDDARAVRAALDGGARTLVVGGGFIGSEVAAAARRRGLPVTLVEAMPVPLVRAVGPEIGSAVARLHEENGVDLRCGITVTGVSGTDRVEQVDLSDGSVLDVDLVVVGIGAVPETDWLRSSGLDVDDGVVCDETLSAGTPGVYAAGDVARWRSGLFGRSLRVEHWTAAAEQGALAARNALGSAAAERYDEVPYFWSDCYDRKMQFAGVAEGVEEVHIAAGDLESAKFTALYRRDDRIVGAFTMNNPGHSAKCQRLIAQRSGWQDALKLIGARRLAR
ncbi:NAD(P)/FAD-dependent oxidoreductase [Saccharopolyspora gloriosae]|uniref:NAD(P)/FAD-dependent oxidoreductase n=1 Tax=Saccharopolyspora gloriosae TaxID=455344 RepID=UPI001FB77FA9|nr:FAD-dependent oxidoreductase [Saccharopolyspora gloriosae]